VDGGSRWYVNTVGNRRPENIAAAVALGAAGVGLLNRWTVVAEEKVPVKADG
jgi:hypothetical protein